MASTRVAHFRSTCLSSSSRLSYIFSHVSWAGLHAGAEVDNASWALKLALTILLAEVNEKVQPVSEGWEMDALLMGGPTKHTVKWEIWGEVEDCDHFLIYHGYYPPFT